MELDLVGVRDAPLDHRKRVGGKELRNAQEQAWGGPLEIYKHVTLGGLISDGLQRAVADRLSEPDLHIVTSGILAAAWNDHFEGAETLLGNLAFLVDAERRPANEDEQYVWARVKENFGEERALRDRILTECFNTGKVRARRAHHCVLCLKDPAIERGDIYHAYHVRGEGTLVVCKECASEHGLADKTEKEERVALLTTRGLDRRKIRARKTQACMLCQKPAILPGDSYHTSTPTELESEWFGRRRPAKVCAKCITKYALQERPRTVADFLQELLVESEGVDADLLYGEGDSIESKFKASVRQAITRATRSRGGLVFNRRAAIKVQYWGEELLDEWMAYAQRLVMEQWFELWSNDDRAALLAVFGNIEQYAKRTDQGTIDQGDSISPAVALVGHCPFLRSIFTDIADDLDQYAADAYGLNVEADPPEAADFEEHGSTRSKFNAANADFKFKSILHTTDSEDEVKAAANVQYWGELLLLDEWVPIAQHAIESKMEGLDDLDQRALIAVYERVVSIVNTHTADELDAAGYPFRKVDCGTLENIRLVLHEEVEIDENYLSHPDVRSRPMRHHKKRASEDF